MAGTDRIVVSAESVRDFYIAQVHADPAKVDVIYNAVDFAQGETTTTRGEMRASLGVPANARVAGVIARLTEQKGHRFLLDALATTPALADVHVLLIGGGDLQNDLLRRAESLGLSQRVHFLGPRRDLGNLLGAMDVFVMPSLWEGLPLAGPRWAPGCRWWRPPSPEFRRSWRMAARVCWFRQATASSTRCRVGARLHRWTAPRPHGPRREGVIVCAAVRRRQLRGFRQRSGIDKLP
jgi:glycosyltransferase involved in cell wall biosynthesis